MNTKKDLENIPSKEAILSEILQEYSGELIQRTYPNLEFINDDTEQLLLSRDDQTIITEPSFFDPVRVFNIPIVNYKCSLNERGRKRYGKIEDLIFEKQSKVGTKYGYIELPEIRKSRQISSIFEFQGEDLEEIVMNNISYLCNQDKVYWDKKSKYTVLEYREGDFFAEHRDHKINRNHFGTLLIFPPAIHSLEHTGGDLIFENNNFDKIVPTSNNKNWKCVIFQTHLKHACHKILSGRRIVLKTELYKKRNKPYTGNSDNEYDYYNTCNDGGIVEFTDEDSDYSLDDICID